MNIKILEKIDKDRYKVIIDSIELYVYEDVLVKYNLLYKKQIDDELYHNILEDNNFYEVYNSTLIFCLKKQRSNLDVKKFLAKNNISILEQNKIIDKLNDLGIINEVEFVRTYIHEKLICGNDGPLKIKNKLLEMEINEEIIDSEISNIDSSILFNKAKKIILRKYRLNKKYSKNQFIYKVKYDMSVNGFNESIVDDVVNELEFNDTNLVEKEYDKIYLKLSKKYEGNKLNYMISQKLYSKGFNSDEIGEIIQKKSGNNS